MRTTGSEKKASSAATIMSQTQAEHEPAGNAGALHHRDGGLGDLPPTAAHAQVDLHLAGETLVTAWLVDVIPPHGGLVLVLDVMVASRSSQGRDRH